jgi:hypothetical protein
LLIASVVFFPKMTVADRGSAPSLSDVDASLKRPPKVKVVWGAEGAPGTIPPFDAVIESVGIKYTMFDGNGRPLRATVRLGFKQARKLKVVQPR